MIWADPSPTRSAKGVTAYGVPYAITVEYREGAAPADDPIRILGRFEIDGEYAHFFVDPHPEGYFAGYVEKPFAVHGEKKAVLDSVADSPWLCLPESIREAARKAIEATADKKDTGATVILEEREDWKRYKAAMQVVAAKFGVSVRCYQKYSYLNVRFETDGLTADEAAALDALADLVMYVSEFLEGMIQRLAPSSLEAD